MVAERTREVIFVGLPGSSHNYGGLSADNVASGINRGSVSNPREAALQALALVRLLNGLGVKTAILPPQLRPDLDLLRTRFSGEADALIAQAAKEDPALLEAASSSSAMWVANAATVAPAGDTADGGTHLTVANLHTNTHRRIEAAATHRTLAAIFRDVPGVAVHPPLPAAQGFLDEGAANHMRLSPGHGARGLHVFVYGTDGSPGDAPTARQNLKASQAVAAQQGIGAAVFVKQNPQAIAQGVFHNDVIAVSNENLLLAHEAAYAGGAVDMARIEAAYAKLHPDKKLNLFLVRENQLSIEEAVRTYVFNSQIVSAKDGMAIIAPTETQELYGGKAAKLLEGLGLAVHYADLRQSMRNGGGPACLRLRVVLSETQIAAMRANVLADEALLSGLEKMIAARYPDRLAAEDLADGTMYRRNAEIQQALMGLMGLPL